MLVIFAAAAGMPRLAGAQDGSRSTAPLAAKLHAQRTLASDLEIGGNLPGLSAGTTRYLTREDLLALQDVNFTVTDDSNFGAATKVKGVQLAELARDLGAPAGDMVVAICSDKYHAHYTHVYMARHEPVLVLEINGKPPSGWPKDSGGHGADMGPYMISHAKFAASFKILSQVEQPQNPWGVVRLDFRSEQAVFDAIAPRGPDAKDAEVQAGYRIAEVNCFRCHNSGAEGGEKAGVPWDVLATIATTSPDFFTEYVRDPKSKNPETQMAASPQYDGKTMHALIAYFRTFSPAEKP
jgi:mono/diheme cytochrome c family protein